MASATSRSQATPNITLKDYQNFIDNPCFKEDMKSDHLNQIIQMNGFIKLHRRRKSEILEALSKIEVMKPQRSTLHDWKISPNGSSLTVEEVNQDLEALEWLECPVQSLETLTDHHQTETNGGGEDDLIEKITAVNTTTTKPRSKRGRRKRKIQNIYDDGGCCRTDVVPAVDEVAVNGGGCGDGSTAVDEVVDAAAVDDADSIFADLLPLWYPS